MRTTCDDDLQFFCASLLVFQDFFKFFATAVSKLALSANIFSNFMLSPKEKPWSRS